MQSRGSPFDSLDDRASIGSVAAVSVGALAFLIYLTTLAVSITWRHQGADSGDLVAAAYTLGIPHPPGYPIYTMLSAAFAHLPFGEPARNVALFSSLTASGAVVVLQRAARSVIQAEELPLASEPIATLVAFAVAFAPLFWSQAIIPEVYSLNALLVALILAACLSKWKNRIEVTFLAFGLGLAHHPSIVLVFPCAIVLLADAGWNKAHLAKASALLLAPLLFYLYLPIRASFNPPINWGNPQTLEGVWWTVSAAPYRPYLFSLTIADLYTRTVAAAALLFQQFNAFGVFVGLWGLARMASSGTTRVRRWALALSVGFVVVLAYSLAYVSRDSFLYLLPAFMIYALWIAFGAGDIVNRLRSFQYRAAFLGALLLIPGYNLVANYRGIDVSDDRTAIAYAEEVFKTTPSDGVVFADSDERLFSLWYYRYVTASGKSGVTVVSPQLLQFDWYYDQMRRSMPYLPDVNSYGSRLHAIIDQNLARGHPVSTTAGGEWLAEYVLEARGVTAQIVKRGP